MLLIVCPNLAIDRIVEVPGFRASAVQRSASAIVQPGGKGPNVARVFRQLGGEVALTGFVGRRNGRWIPEPLREMGIEVETLDAYDGDSRTCTIVLDPVNHGHPTVINEESPFIEGGSSERLMGVVDSWLPRVSAVLATGSLAKGLPGDFYRILLDRARTAGKLTALDAAGEALAEGVKAVPDFLKINAQEFGELAGLPVGITHTTSVKSYLNHAGAGLARQTVVTFGEAGAILNSDGLFWQAAPPDLFHTNPIGAGDAFAAGYIYEFLKNRNIEDSLRCALAAAASDAKTIRPGHVDVAEVESLLKAVQIERV